MAAARAVEEVGALGNVLHYARNSARGDVARHALADAVDPPAPLLLAEPVRGADYEHVAVPERDSPARKVHLRVKNVEHLLEQRGNVLDAHRDPADFVQNRDNQPPLSRDLREFLLVLFARHFLFGNFYRTNPHRAQI